MATKSLAEALEWAAEFLPAQGPLHAFVHHNTLHAFQHLSFEEAVLQAAQVYGCNAYMPSQWYRAELTRGRLTRADLEWALDRQPMAPLCLPPNLQARELCLALLLHPIHRLPPERLHWHLSETGARWRLRLELEPVQRRRLVEEAQRYRESAGEAAVLKQLSLEFPEEWGSAGGAQLAAAPAERLAAQLLWVTCLTAVDGMTRPGKTVRCTRPRDRLLLAGGLDIDSLVNPQLSRWCAAFLDQGIAEAAMPGREQGLYRAILSLYRGVPVAVWMEDFARLGHQHDCPWACLEASLSRLGVPEDEWASFLRDTMLALKGWAGMIQQAQARPDRMPFQAVPARLEDFCALRLVLEECALAYGLRQAGRKELPPPPEAPPRCTLTLAYHMFQVCQFLGVGAASVASWSRDQVESLFEALDSFGSPLRREILHQAYERRFELKSFHALTAHAPQDAPARPSFQAVFCLDDREESIRRHLEEAAPDCETFGTLGYFGIAMYFKAAHEAKARPLCPVALRPQALVEELPLEPDRQLAGVRRSLGTLQAGLETSSHSLTWGSLLTSGLGLLSALPGILQVLFPRRTGWLSRGLRRRLRPSHTRLKLFRRDPDGPGFAVHDMAEIVCRVLSPMGLTEGFAPLLLIIGHGSSSLNNPHEAAYDCGACGGGQGGPNARAFAQMANHPEVRAHLADLGLRLPSDTVFVGAYHDTCEDGLEVFDEDLVPESHRAMLQQARASFREALAGNALERCRRFQSAPDSLSGEVALQHVGGRAADLAQPRPELGHATNALAILGRRKRTRGLFLDRRAFLASYDPERDDAEGTRLEGLLESVLPVGAGINLEYYFSRVDNAGYGCGTKLPHNLTGLLGVMEGYCSDLRTGLPWQMVEIHEPMRLLVVIEAARARLDAILARRPDLERWVRNRWVKLAALAPDEARLWRWDEGVWCEPAPLQAELPHVEHSTDWFLHKPQHLDFAEVGHG